jgi:DNA mismatch repair protein MLH3
MSLLSITSHHHLHRSHNSLGMHKSQVISRQIPAPPQQQLPYFAHGTRVTVRDLFGGMPVRVKQRAITAEKHGGNSKEWDILKRDVVALLLSWPLGISMTLREIGPGQKMVIRTPSIKPESGSTAHVSKICNILSQASFITASERSSWVSVRASTANLTITGAISLNPSATKSVQFVAFGIQPLIAFDRQSILHDEINRLFQNSAFGNEEEAVELNAVEMSRRAQDGRYIGDGFTTKELKGARKGVDRWPMFYINAQQKSGSFRSRKIDVDDILDEKGNSLSDLVHLIQAMILEFLAKNHFQPKGRQGRNLSHTPSGDSRLLETSTQHSRDSTPAQKSILKKTGHSKGLLSNSDLLGANVKLPSFQRSSSNSNSPFDAWSRVKSGTSTVKPTAIEDLTRMAAIRSPLLRPATAPLPHSHHSSLTLRSSTPGTARSSKSSKAHAPVISSSGKITRRPFEDTVLSPSIAIPIIPEDKLRNIDAVDNGDDITMWTNPITKATSLVNIRTGLTIPAMKPGDTEISVATSGTRLATWKKLKSTIEPREEVSSPWIDSLLRNWDNPVFRPVELSIPQVFLDTDGDTQHVLHGHKHNYSQLDIDKAFKEVSTGINGQITKDALRKAEVISQVDKKFILVKLKCRSRTAPPANTLVIIDQHAADERIRIEILLSELCAKPNPALPGESSILTTTLEKPLTLEVSMKEIKLLRTHQQHFTNWGIIYDVPTHDIPTSDRGTRRLLVRALPHGVAERCKLDSRLLIELIRTEVHHINSSSSSTSSPRPTEPEAQHNWLTNIHTCPQGILDMLNSRACRSAIMFNDVLSKQQCEVLVRRLADCAFPFQCAHGRPSLVPLVDLGSDGNGGFAGMGRDDSDGDRGGFGKEFRKWKMKKGEGST